MHSWLVPAKRSRLTFDCMKGLFSCGNSGRALILEFNPPFGKVSEDEHPLFPVLAFGVRMIVMH